MILDPPWVHRIWAITLSSLLVVFVAHGSAPAQQTAGENAATTRCRVEPVNYKGWEAEQVSNRWVQLVVVPQNGGRLMQVTFGGHPYLFVNAKYAGKYFPPTAGRWFNYGGDKMWLLPEGNNDEQHWVGDSDVIDDAPFAFRKVSEGQHCEIELTGPSDPQTGIQFQRTISLDSDSPRIKFHAVMKNVTGHSLEWSMQSVSQYNTAVQTTSANATPTVNRDFWAFTPANPSSSYLDRYHVRFGPAENPSASVRDDGLFTVHYMHMAAELWVDSTAGWLTVFDRGSRYAMVERFQYEETRAYPGKASVIFWMNGPQVRVGEDGTPSMSEDSDASPIYMEAELNSPLCRLRAGESCGFDTEWYPTRAGEEFHGVTDAGIVIRPLQVTRLADEKLKLSGSFGVFFSGSLVTHFYDAHGSKLGDAVIANVNPDQPVSLESEVPMPEKATRLSLHLIDQSGMDCGSLQEIQLATGDNR